MSERTGDQILEEEQRILGAENGTIYRSLEIQIIWLDVKWKEFKTMYCNSENVEILRRTAAFFFSMDQQIRLDDILLEICKITSELGHKYPYLSIKRLPGCVSLDYKDEVERLVADAIKKAKFAEDRRNRVIAHTSLDFASPADMVKPLDNITITDIDDEIEALRRIIVFFNVQIFRQGFSFDTIYPLSNANALVRKLKRTI